MIVRPTNSPCNMSRYAQYRLYAWCTYLLRFRGMLAYSPGVGVNSSVGVLAVGWHVALNVVHWVHYLFYHQVHLPLLAFSIGECISWCIVSALPIWWLLVVGVVWEPSAVILLCLKVVALTTSDHLGLHMDYWLQGPELGIIRKAICSCQSQL